MLNTQPDLLGGAVWLEVRDGNPTGLALFRRHYSNQHGAAGPLRFVGPGERMVLITPCARALFVWRKERFRFDGQGGVNCSVFRREPGAPLASELIREADALAWQRWPGQRLFTFVNPRRVRSANPGWCFQCAGYRACGVSKTRGYLIFEKLPP